MLLLLTRYIDYEENMRLSLNCFSHNIPSKANIEWLIDWLIIQGFDELGSLKQTRWLWIQLYNNFFTGNDNFRGPTISKEVEEWQVHWGNHLLKPDESGSTYNLLGNTTISEVGGFQTKLRNGGGFTGINLYWNKMSLDPLITYWGIPQFQRLEDLKRSWGMVVGSLE
jgi:hypothetical protein